uniref:Uncharacterized protein n=1 Tax=Kryptolebias marmoratus TaxID=37003 RepID=A0A3Q3FZZ7_KRYMA
PSFPLTPTPSSPHPTHPSHPTHPTAAQRYSATRIQAGYEPERSVFTPDYFYPPQNPTILLG